LFISKDRDVNGVLISGAFLAGVNELQAANFPSLKKRGGCAVDAAGVVSSGKSTGNDHPGLRTPLFSRRGKKAISDNSFTATYDRTLPK
jgi:hypothetical protein